VILVDRWISHLIKPFKSWSTDCRWLFDCYTVRGLQTTVARESKACACLVCSNFS